MDTMTREQFRSFLLDSGWNYTQENFIHSVDTVNWGRLECGGDDYQTIIEGSFFITAQCVNEKTTVTYSEHFSYILDDIDSLTLSSDYDFYGYSIENLNINVVDEDGDSLLKSELIDDVSECVDIDIDYDVIDYGSTTF